MLPIYTCFGNIIRDDLQWFAVEYISSRPFKTLFYCFCASYRTECKMFSNFFRLWKGKFVVGKVWILHMIIYIFVIAPGHLLHLCYLWPRGCLATDTETADKGKSTKKMDIFVLFSDPAGSFPKYYSPPYPTISIAWLNYVVKMSSCCECVYNPEHDAVCQ